MEILKASSDDLKEILEVQHLSFLSEAEEMNDFNIQPLNESLESLEERFKSKIILKAVENNKIIGSISGYMENNTCFIEKLFIHPDYRGNGYSNKLIEAILEEFKDSKHFRVFTSAISKRNIYLYKKFGFKIEKEEYIDKSKFVYFVK